MSTPEAPAATRRPYADLCTRIYSPRGAVAHLAEPGWSGAPLCPSVAPRHGWFGTGSQDEYDRAASLPLCSRCRKLAEARDAAPQTQTQTPAGAPVSAPAPPAGAADRAETPAGLDRAARLAPARPGGSSPPQGPPPAPVLPPAGAGTSSVLAAACAPAGQDGPGPGGTAQDPGVRAGDLVPGDPGPGRADGRSRPGQGLGGEEFRARWKAERSAQAAGQRGDRGRRARRGRGQQYGAGQNRRGGAR